MYQKKQLDCKMTLVCTRVWLTQLASTLKIYQELLEGMDYPEEEYDELLLSIEDLISLIKKREEEVI